MKRSAMLILLLLILTACGPKAGTPPGLATAKPTVPEKPAVPLTTEGVFQAAHDGLVQALEVSCACHDVSCLDGPAAYRKKLGETYERLGPYKKKAFPLLSEATRADYANMVTGPPERKLWDAYQAQVKDLEARHSECETTVKK